MVRSDSICKSMILLLRPVSTAKEIQHQKFLCWRKFDKVATGETLHIALQVGLLNKKICRLFAIITFAICSRFLSSGGGKSMGEAEFMISLPSA